MGIHRPRGVRPGTAAFLAGSFAYLDPYMQHYATANGEVVVQVHATSPLQFNYVNPNDDPSRKRQSLAPLPQATGSGLGWIGR